MHSVQESGALGPDMWCIQTRGWCIQAVMHSGNGAFSLTFLETTPTGNDKLGTKASNYTCKIFID